MCLGPRPRCLSHADVSSSLAPHGPSSFSLTMRYSVLFACLHRYASRRCSLPGNLPRLGRALPAKVMLASTLSVATADTNTVLKLRPEWKDSSIERPEGDCFPSSPTRPLCVPPSAACPVGTCSSALDSAWAPVLFGRITDHVLHAIPLLTAEGSCPEKSSKTRVRPRCGCGAGPIANADATAPSSSGRRSR